MHSLANNITRPTLGDVLNNETSYPYSLDDFATYLDQSYCLENLEFWFEVRRYRYYASNFYNSNSSTTLLIPEMVISDASDFFDDALLRGDAPAHLDFLKQKLHGLIATFILPNSPKEINIPSEIREDLLTNVFQYNNYHPSVLDPVGTHVYELMQASSFNQFLIEAGNIELRMSSEESEGHDSDHSSHGIRSKTNKYRTKQTFGAGLRQKYKKFIKRN